MEISGLKNSYQGERVFLIGNGPSLKDTPLEKLDEEYTFAVNNINSIYDEVDWRPDFYYYHSSDFGNWESVIRDNIESGIECFIWEEHKPVFGEADNIHYLTMYDLIPRAKTTPTIFHERNIKDINQLSEKELYNYWSEDIEELIYHHHSMYGMYQIIFYLGFNEIYLVGTDLGFEPVTPHMISKSGRDPLQYSTKSSFLAESIRSRTPVRSLMNGLLYKILLSDDFANLSDTILDIISVADDDHFASDYNLSPRDYTHLNHDIPRNHYVVKRIASFESIDIYNATLGGELEIFPRKNINEVLEGHCSD